MSLKDALNNGVGGHSLSVEDFQTVATELLFQEKPRKCNDHEGASVQVDNADVPVQIMKQMKTNFSMNRNLNTIPLNYLLFYSNTG